MLMDISALYRVTSEASRRGLTVLLALQSPLSSSPSSSLRCSEEDDGCARRRGSLDRRAHRQTTDWPSLSEELRVALLAHESQRRARVELKFKFTLHRYRPTSGLHFSCIVCSTEREGSMTSPAMLGRTSRRITALVSRQVASLPTPARLHISSILRAEVSDKDPQLGEYPQLPFVSLQRRKYDPRWWDPQEKRNFGEEVSEIIIFPFELTSILKLILLQLHEQDDVLGVWAPDVFEKPASSALRQFLIAMGVAATFAGTVYVTLPNRPSQPRQYPRDGLLAELGGVPGTAVRLLV
jgi:NADH dehydrogenase (ubiquinone) 1 beta subcomplex subunit 8